MSMYRFFGTLTEVGELRLIKFGQMAEFTDKEASNVILGGGCIVPADHPAAKEFTDQELSLYSNPNSHGDANRAFQDKKKRVQAVWFELRAKLEAGEPLKAVSTPASAPSPKEPTAPAPAV